MTPRKRTRYTGREMELPAPPAAPALPLTAADIPVQLYRLADAAERLAIHPKTLRRYIAKGLVHVVTIGSHPRISEAELRRLAGMTS